MQLCREFHALPEPGGLLDQDAELMLKWQGYLEVEGKVEEARRRRDEARARSRAR